MNVVMRERSPTRSGHENFKIVCSMSGPSDKRAFHDERESGAVIDFRSTSGRAAAGSGDIP
ncbi:MAG: hypothetical protein ABMA01_13585, partial [Chthoniobacteraceae bacterium]